MIVCQLPLFPLMIDFPPVECLHSESTLESRLITGHLHPQSRTHTQSHSRWPVLTWGLHPSQARPNIWNLKLRPSAKKPPPSPLIIYRSIIIPRLAHLTITHDAPVFVIVLHFDKDHQHTLHISEPFQYACILFDRPCLARWVIVVRTFGCGEREGQTHDALDEPPHPSETLLETSLDCGSG